MSSQEILLQVFALMTLTILVIKWSKSLMFVVLMESTTILVLSILMLKVGSQLVVMMVMFAFFVGEALIIISALFSLLRVTGMAYSALSLV